jgi:hypothetical protein
MLLVMSFSEAGIHHAKPATPVLPAWRASCTKKTLSFTIADVASWVVVIQTLPTSGSFTGMTGPASRRLAKNANGSALLAVPSKSKGSGARKEYGSL